MFVTEKTYNLCVSGSNDPPGQFAPPCSYGSVSKASGPCCRLRIGGEKSGPNT